MKKILLTILVFWLAAFPATGKAVKIVDDVLLRQLSEKTAVSQADIALYRQIFAAEKQGDFAKVDQLVSQLKSNALMGHVLAEKYLHKKYKSSYRELQLWLQKYFYLPQAERIRALALTKAPDYKPVPPAATTKRIRAYYDWFKDRYDNLSEADRRYLRPRLDEFVLALRGSKFAKAEKMMQDKRLQKLLPVANYDGMAASLATAYFLEGNNRQALLWSKQPVARSKNVLAMWFGGLAAWKDKNYQLASDYFGRLGKSGNNDRSLVAAGAYWAYRSELQLGHAKAAQRYLHLAAAERNTFYGLLAEYQLHGKLKRSWQPTAYYNNLKRKNACRKELLALPVLRRALLLLQVGENDLAEAELKQTYRRLNAKQKELLLYVSEQYGLANLSYVIASHLGIGSARTRLENFMYPLPDWHPENGWQENPAWIWALIRQESLFVPTVRSHAGACGLMQVMPATAAQVTENKKLKTDPRPLLERGFNMRVGQSYVSYLRGSDYIGDNLFFLAAAYNGGPHNLQKWQSKIDYEGDPLLFVEQIPWRETRLYAKKVLANYWLYRLRYGQSAQSLQQLSQGKWPLLD